MPLERDGVAMGVVLGCRVSDAGAPSPALVRRLHLGRRLLEERYVRRLMVSGGKRWPGGREAEVMADWLRDRGIEGVELETRSHSTWENARYASEWLRREGYARAMLITCRWHLARAGDNFRRFGIEPVAPPLHLDATPAPSARRTARESLCRRLDEGLFYLWSWLS